MDTRSAWSMDYPAGWRLQIVDEDGFEYHNHGAIVSNLDHEFGHAPPGSSSLWDMRGLPAGLVVIEVSDITGGIVRPATDEPFTETLDLASFRSISMGKYANGAPDPSLTKTIGSLGHTYRMWVWMGEKAADGDRQAAAEVIASLRFAPDPGPSPSGAVGPPACPTPDFRPTYFTWDDQDPAEPRLEARGADPVLTWDISGGGRFSIVRHAEVLGSGADTAGDFQVMRYPAWFEWVDQGGHRVLTMSWQEAEKPYRGYSLELYEPAFDGSDSPTIDQDAQQELIDTALYIGFPDDHHLTLSPASGAVGDRIEFTGQGFEEGWWGLPVGGYNISLIGGPAPEGCQIIATVPEGNFHVEFGPGGRATGWFIVPGEAFCFQGDGKAQSVSPGRWAVVLGCHVCDVAEFEVLP